MTQNPRVVRGYAAALTTALNTCKDGAMIEIDVGTGQGAREILLDYARSLEPKVRVGRMYYVLLWNEDHPLLHEVAKTLDAYLAVDLTDAMERVLSALPETGVRETVATWPGKDGEVQFVTKGQPLARALPWQELRHAP
jgi:hypothetical protein